MFSSSECNVAVLDQRPLGKPGSDRTKEDGRDSCVKLGVDTERFSFEVQATNCVCKRFRRHRLAEIGVENRIVGWSFESLRSHERLLRGGADAICSSEPHPAVE